MKARSFTFAVFMSFVQIAIAQEQDPCTVLGIPLFGAAPGGPDCSLNTSSGNTEINLRLSAVTISELRALIAEVKMLRTEMKAFSAVLEQTDTGIGEMPARPKDSLDSRTELRAAR
jgi:hypothetical protein